MKKPVLLIALLIIIIGITIVLWSACYKHEPIKPYESVLKLGGMGGKPSIINPMLTDSTVSHAAVQMIFNGLVKLDKEMLPQGDLAESWDISPDGLIYTFHLRKGIKFHDNIELTADDCKFTYETLTNPETGCSWRSYFDMVKSWEAIDKYTFRITLKEPCAALLSRLGSEYIIPKHLLAGKDIKTDSFNFHPVGTGPYRFIERTNDDKIILEANKDYYEGAPKIQRVIATGYDTETQCWGAFMRGEIDLIFFISKENFEIAKRDPDFKTYSFTAPYTYGLEYNLEHPFFKDQRVRSALNYAINTKKIIEKMESGYGTPATGPFLPGSWSANPNIKPIEYNPKHALELLEEAGWALNKNNILEKESKEFRITLLVNNNMRNVPMIARFIYQNLYDVGIRMDIKNFDYEKPEEEQYKKLASESGLYLNMFVIMSDPTEGARDWHSKYTIRNAKLWSYQNPELDKLLDEGQVTTDINKRKKIYYRINEILFEEQPVNFLYFLYHLGAANSRFTNTDGIFSATMPFWTIKDWRIKE